MGKRGEKRSAAARDTADDLVGRLGPLGDVRARGMFGGFGLFHDDAMFGLVDSHGVAHLRVTATTESDFVERDARRHGRMPYYAVPAEILDDAEALLAWAGRAAEGARAAKDGQADDA